jgi:hypothetical protein
MNVLLDVTVGTYQSRYKFWRRIKDYYCNCNTPGFYHTWGTYRTILITPMSKKILKLGSSSFVYKDIQDKQFRKIIK